MNNSVKVIGFIELPKLVERGFYFGEWSDNSAYIINKVTEKVVDTVVSVETPKKTKPKKTKKAQPSEKDTNKDTDTP